jgi:hypothetical protein
MLPVEGEVKVFVCLFKHHAIESGNGDIVPLIHNLGCCTAAQCLMESWVDPSASREGLGERKPYYFCCKLNPDFSVFQLIREVAVPNPEGNVETHVSRCMPL